MTEFEQMVLEMRKAQKDYFRWREPEMLKKSKELEREIDAYLKRREAAQQDLTPDMFRR